MGGLAYEKETQIIRRIPKHYVGDGFVQYMVAYKQSLTILNKNTILYHHVAGNLVLTNKYLEDRRRNQFPYSNITTHCSKKRIIKI